ncbi:MAG: hypothetical protein A2V75_02615 [Actinobacteria bacterium RBG_16_70_17]|nr:MAG: hypothetical protein A2V75_02615 [Actinobacteria bacterium RBG_16_70_17]
MPAASRNRLAGAASPYLLEHADNPVEWFEWGDEAFAEARRRDVPILLSVGYASCHWCHVMAAESFTDRGTADLMNRWFVNVKVDREERPDLDRHYLEAVQALTGQGGWPLTAFLTPSGEAFFGGTYFPKVERSGLPAFASVLAAVHQGWQDRREQVVSSAADLAERLSAPLPPAGDVPAPSLPAAAYRSVAASYDPAQGGFGGPPKFPQAATLEFLLRASGAPWAPEARAMLHRTLTAMADGGIHDQVGGGFSRYTVDAAWRVPHFEKMLGDNALLGRLYARAWQLTGDEYLAAVARRTLDYVLAALTLPGGGFASSEDADSEGEEGRFYTFSNDEFQAVAGPSAPLAAAVLGVTPEGDLDGKNVLRRDRRPAEVAAAAGATTAEVEDAVTAALAALARHRAGRARPHLDDKVVAAGNGLAIRALAEAATVLAEPRYLAAAEEAARFVLGDLRRPDGRLLRARRAGRGEVPAFCEDYASVALGLFTLYRATGEPSWFTAAAGLVEDMVDLFRDPRGGAFFTTGRDVPARPARRKDFVDNPTPSDNSLAAEALLTLAAYTGDEAAREQADGVFQAGGLWMERAPSAVGHLLGALLVALAPPRQLAVVGPPGHPGTRALLAVAEEQYRPALFVARGDGVTSGGVPLLESRPLLDGRPAAYLCRDSSCAPPTADPAELRRMLNEAFLVPPARA